MENNPEAVTLLREITEVLQAHNSGLFSDFEWQVWSERLKGYAYTEIAVHLGKPPKSIDNAMQRIRKKVMAYMENENKIVVTSPQDQSLHLKECVII